MLRMKQVFSDAYRDESIFLTEKNAQNQSMKTLNI